MAKFIFPLEETSSFRERQTGREYTTTRIPVNLDLCIMITKDKSRDLVYINFELVGKVRIFWEFGSCSDRDKEYDRIKAFLSC